MDGLEFLKTFRTSCDAPGLVLSAKLEESDRVHGLDPTAPRFIRTVNGMGYRLDVSADADDQTRLQGHPPA